NAVIRSNYDTGRQGYGSRCSRRAVANCGDRTASSQRDDFERWSAQHAAALECAEGAVAAGHVAVVGCSGSASVAVAVAVAVGCSGPASVVAELASAAYPGSAVAGHAAVGCSGPASVVAELASAAYPGSAVAGHAAVGCSDPASVAVAACPGSVAADRAVVQAWLGRSPFAVAWVGLSCCLACHSARKREQLFQASMTRRLR